MRRSQASTAAQSERGRWEPSARPAERAAPERPGMTGTVHPRYRMAECPAFLRDEQGGTVDSIRP